MNLYQFSEKPLQKKEIFCAIQNSKINKSGYHVNLINYAIKNMQKI